MNGVGKVVAKLLIFPKGISLVRRIFDINQEFCEETTQDTIYIFERTN